MTEVWTSFPSWLQWESSKRGVALAAPDQGHEAARPGTAGNVAQVRVRREQILMHDSIVAAVDPVAALYRIGETRSGREVLDARIVKLMGPNQRRCTGLRCRPRPTAGFAKMHIAATDRSVMHDDVGRERADHFDATPVAFDAPCKVHQSATFGIRGQPG